MSIIIVLILAAAVVWYLLKYFDKAPDLKVNEAREAAQRTAKQLGDSSSGLIEKLRGRFDHSAEQEEFKRWITGLVDNAPGVGDGATTFRTWIEGLEVADLRNFRSKLAAFCETLDIEADWLHDGQLDERPELRRTLEETVGLYALAYARGAGQRDDIARTRAFQRWMAAPDRFDNRAFGTKLYTALVNHGMVTPPPELLLAPERERRAFAQQAIRESAARDPQGFGVLLAEVVQPQAKAEAAPEAEVLEDPQVIAAEAEPTLDADAQPASTGGRRNRQNV